MRVFLLISGGRDKATTDGVLTPVSKPYLQRRDLMVVFYSAFAHKIDI